SGYHELARSLFDRGFRVPPTHMKAISHCAASGDLDMVKWLHAEKLTEGTSGWIRSAAAFGHLHIVEWVHANIPTESCGTAAMDQAAGSGRLDMLVQWLHNNRVEGCTTNAMNWAARHDHLEVVQWLHENRAEGCTTDAMDVEDANFEKLLFLKENNLDVEAEMFSPDTFQNCEFENCNFEIFEWLRANYSEEIASYEIEWDFVPCSELWAMYFQ
ncbi:hypothetical protein PybrP1_006083, partial [[Pythium] brassicae (nom. inval.)]